MQKIIRYILNPFYRSDQALADAQERSFFWKNLTKQFAHNRLGVYSLRLLYVFILTALLADIIADEKPLVIKYKGNLYFPVLRSYAVDMGIAQWPPVFGGNYIDWKRLQSDWAVFPPVPYAPQSMDEDNIHSISPFGDQRVASVRWRHWLGTDELGRDVLSGMIHGTRIALTVGLVSMGIASLFGIFIGAIAGYFGDERLKISRVGAVLNVLFFFLGIFWGFMARSYEITGALSTSLAEFIIQVLFSVFILVIALVAGNLLAVPFRRIPFLGKKMSVPIDIILSRFIEVMVCIPTLFLIITISAIVSHPSIYIVMTIIGLTSWTGIARFIRAEMLRIRALEYIESAHALGFSEWRIIFRHAMPNALSPVLITVAFGIASAILIESTLSFLGVGVSAETVTWGSLLAAARQSPSAWWLAVLPGCAIFITVTVFNLIGEALTDALDPRQRK